MITRTARHTPAPYAAGSNGFLPCITRIVSSRRNARPHPSDPPDRSARYTRSTRSFAYRRISHLPVLCMPESARSNQYTVARIPSQPPPCCRAHGDQNNRGQLPVFATPRFALSSSPHATAPKMSPLRHVGKSHLHKGCCCLPQRNLRNPRNCKLRPVLRSLGEGGSLAEGGLQPTLFLQSVVLSSFGSEQRNRPTSTQSWFQPRHNSRPKNHQKTRRNLPKTS